MSKAETFRKEERLYLKKDFEELIKENNYFIYKPLKVYWKEVKATHHYPVKFGVSVPKRIFAKATDRNRIKRQLREAYRKNKAIVYDSPGEKKNILLVLAIYTSGNKVQYLKLEESLKMALERISKRNE
jgi:ribonuclease P protein component